MGGNTLCFYIDKFIIEISNILTIWAAHELRPSNR